MTIEEKSETFAEEIYGRMKKAHRGSRICIQGGAIKDLVARSFSRGAEYAIERELNENSIVWHDLQENRKDLPEKNGRYLCKVRWFIDGREPFVCLTWDSGTWYDGYFYAIASVIKWAEIP